MEDKKYHFRIGQTFTLNGVYRIISHLSDNGRYTIRDREGTFRNELDEKCLQDQFNNHYYKNLKQPKTNSYEIF